MTLLSNKEESLGKVIASTHLAIVHLLDFNMKELLLPQIALGGWLLK